MADALTLASASPRRLELLRLAGLSPAVVPADVDETLRPGEGPESYARRVAGQKAAAVSSATGGVVLGADTIVVLDDEVLGKPADPAHAVAMLRRLSGRTHQVTTAVVVHRDGAAFDAVAVTTQVTMADLPDTAVTRYAATGEPLDKAGGYGIQGGAAAFVRSIAGSYTNVVGLPLVEALELLQAAGVDVW